MHFARGRCILAPTKPPSPNLPVMSQGPNQPPTPSDPLPGTDEEERSPRDIPPLNEYLGAYLRRWMGKPPSWEAEKAIGQILKHQLMGFFRAALITGALALLAFKGLEQLKPFYHWLGEGLGAAGQYWVLGACLALLVFSVLLPRFFAAFQRVRLWGKHRHYLPFWTLLPAGGLLVSGFYQSPVWGWVCGLSLFTLMFVQLKAPISSPEMTTDSFQRSSIVKGLVKHFEGAQRSLRRIGVFGTWGSGKTTVLKLLREALEDSKSKKFRVAWVNPWTAKTPEEALDLIAQGFDEALGRSPLSFLSWSWLGAIKAGFDNGLSLDLHRLINGGAIGTEAKLIERINGRMAAMNVTVVLLVDDMERAECEVIRRLFPLIDRLGSLKHGFFVFAVDPDRVAKAFKETSSGDEETKGYLDKVFDLKMTLPNLRPKDVDDWLKSRIKPHETPKLHAAWDKLKDFLSINPREAVHFIDDAQFQETLFLSRLSDDELGCDFFRFFLVRMLSLEVPAFMSWFNRQNKNQYIEDSLEKSDSESDANEKAWISLSNGNFIPKYKHERLKKIQSNILSSHIDHEWVIHNYMRVLTPTREEMDQIYDLWIIRAKDQSLVSIIQKISPVESFSDLDVVGIETVARGFRKYQDLRTELIGMPSSTRSINIRQEATKLLECITVQFQYSFSDVAHLIERKFFPPNLFKGWLEMLCKNNLNQAPDVAGLVAQEYRFHTLLSGLLPLEERFHFASQSIKDLDDEGDYFNALEDHREHLENLQKHMESQVLADFISLMEGGKLHDSDSFRSLGIGSLRDVFMDPDYWLSEENEQSVIAGFPERAAKSPQFATATAAITEAILKKVKLRLRDSRKDPSKKTPIRSITRRPAYFQDFWKAAHLAPDRVVALNSLREEVEEVLNQLPKNSDDPILTLEQFEAAFPRMHEREVTV